MKKFPRAKATGNLGVTFVQTVVSEEGSIFRAIPQDTDIGIDGYIEFVQNEIATGTLVAVQIKAGESFLKQYSGDSYFSVNASKADMNYWHTHTVPVALIAYDPTTGLSGWLDVTEFIRQHPESLQKENTTLTIHSRSSTFSADTFRDKFKNTFASYRAEADIFKFVNLMASLDGEKRFQGFLGLMSHPKSKFSEITCHLLLECLFDEDNRMRASTTDALSRYLNHPEVGFYPPKEIRDYVQNMLQSFGREQIVQLLGTAWFDEESLMQRGSLGQCAGVIIINIPDYEDHLSYIILHNEFKDEIRLAAIVLAEEFGIELIIERIVYEFEKTDWGSIRDWVKEQAEFLAEFVDRSITTTIENAIDNASYEDEEIAYALRDAGVPVLVLSEYLIAKIEVNTQNPTVKYYAQQAIHKIMKYKGQLDQDMLPGFENS